MPLDALGRDLEPEALAERDDRARDGLRRALVSIVAMRLRSSFTRRERQLLQRDERRVAGPEVIERNAGAEFAHAVASASVVWRPVCSTFSVSSTFDAPRRQLVPFECVPELCTKRLSRSCSAETLTAMRTGGQAARAPARGVFDGRLDHPFADLADQAAVLGDRQERGGARRSCRPAGASAGAPRRRRPRRSARSTSGWKCSSNSPRSTARRRPCSVANLAAAASSSSGLKMRTRLRPWALA